MDRKAWWATAHGVPRVRHDSNKTTATLFNLFNITYVREIIWKQIEDPKQSTEIIKAKRSRNIRSKRIQSRRNWSHYCDWFRLITFDFFPKNTFSYLWKKTETFLTCRSVSWGCWKCPIREVQTTLLRIGSANEKPADSEAQPLTQSVNTCTGLKQKKCSRHVEPLRLRWERDVIKIIAPAQILFSFSSYTNFEVFFVLLQAIDLTKIKLTRLSWQEEITPRF